MPSSHIAAAKAGASPEQTLRGDRGDSFDHSIRSVKNPNFLPSQRPLSQDGVLGRWLLLSSLQSDSPFGGCRDVLRLSG
jgi:hypothetical protein